MAVDPQLTIIPEPLLEFGNGQSVADPHDGLAMFGPYDSYHPSHPANFSYGLVGTEGGIEAYIRWSGKMEKAIPPPSEDSRRLWPTYPGFESAFACVWPSKPTRQITLDEGSVSDKTEDVDANKRASGVVELYLNAIARLAKRDEPIGVVVCVVPDFVYSRCRPLSRVSDGTGYRPTRRVLDQRRGGQMDMLDQYDPAIYQYSVDFRRQLKARSMEYGIPIQILRESTLRDTDSPRFGERGLTPLSDRAWNLGVALYYKSGGKPWRLSSARPGVCYIGIAYRRRDPTSSSRSACCAAQMFLDSGDGIIFMGQYGPWYSPDRNDFHLSRSAARDLLGGVLDTYHQLEGRQLQEVFLHCRSGISDEEFEGFREACPRGVNLVGIRVRQERNDLRLFREGSYPVARGTFLRLSDHRGYLWGSGFKPRLGTYDGWEVPAPLRIDLQHGDAQLTQVANDILGLTKLNYNACRLGDAEPVTIGFSDAVGEILVSNPIVEHRSPKFRFYI